MKSFSDINLGRLELEWLKHPRLYDRYSEQLADAKLDLNEAKAFLEVTEAQTKFNIRRHPKRYGVVGRISNEAVKELLILTEEFQKAQKKVNLAQHSVDVLQGVINLLEHRKRTLESLVQLHGQGYFAKPKLPDSAKTFQSKVEGASFTRGKKMRRKKKKKI